MKKKQQQQHPGGGGADPWPHGAPLGGAPPGLGSWKRWVSLLPFLRFSLRDYGFCMATLLVFCLGSLFYQLGGGPPRFLLDLRQYLGKEGRRARGRRRRREVVRGGGGQWGLAGHLELPLPPPARGSPGGTPASIRAAAPSAYCLLRVRLSAPRLGRRGLDVPGRYPGAGRCIPSPASATVRDGVQACEFVGVYECVYIQAWRRGVRDSSTLSLFSDHSPIPASSRSGRAGGISSSLRSVLRILPHLIPCLLAWVAQGPVSAP